MADCIDKGRLSIIAKCVQTSVSDTQNLQQFRNPSNYVKVDANLSFYDMVLFIFSLRFNMNAIKNFLKVNLSLLRLSPSKLLRIVLIAIILYFLGYKYFYEKNLLGFGEDTNKSVTIEEAINPKDGKIIKLKKETEQFQSAKTLWDWLGLAGTLAIPLVLYLFQISEQRRAEERAKIEKKQAEDLAEVEKDIAENNLREQALEAYIDRMAEILISPTTRSELFLDNQSNYQDNSVRDVARIRTVTILRRLEGDIKRQNRILHFLHDSELLKFLLQNANFANANLKGFNFSGINLDNAIFREANLNGAKFSSSSLNGADFTNANLNSVDFKNAKLFGANFTNTNLNGANFIDTYLNRAIFCDANLSGANLRNSWIQNTKFINADLSNAILINSLTWDEENIENNFDFIDVDGDEFQPPYSQEIWYATDFSGAKLINTNLLSTNLKGAKNLTVEQLKHAKNWDDAIYEDKLFKELEMPEKFMSIINTMFKDVESYEDINFQMFVGRKVEIKKYMDKETKTIIKGEITGFTNLSIDEEERINIKTSDGIELKKVNPKYVYVYMNTPQS